MASFITNYYKAKSQDGTIRIGTDTFKLLLLTTVTGADKDLDFLGSGATANSFTNAGCVEATCTNYVRKTVVPTVAEDDTNDWGAISITAVTWTALGGASNQTILAALLIKDTGSDATSPVIAYFDTTDTPTNGSDFVLTWTSNRAATLT